MPYILQDRRVKLDPHIENLQETLKDLGLTEGDLNYVITRLVAFYFKKEKRYHTIARITGVLDNVKSEFYRRIASIYEDKMNYKNGDVSEFSKVFWD